MGRSVTSEKLRFDQGEAVYIEGTGNELCRFPTRAIDIGDRIAVFLSNDAAQARIVIAASDMREWGKRVREGRDPSLSPLKSSMTATGLWLLPKRRSSGFTTHPKKERDDFAS